MKSHVINKLDSHTNSCSIIPYETIPGRDSLYLMEKAEGDLNQLLTTNIDFVNSNITSILLQCTQVIKCLFDIRLFYTDIKPSNFLYKRNDDGTIRIMIGDLGSADPKGIEMYDAETGTHKYTIPGTYIATYPPIERKESGGLFQYPNEHDLVWMMGIIALGLAGYDPEIYAHNKIGEMTISYHENNMKSLDIDEYPSKYIINAMYAHPESRASLDELIVLAQGDN